LIDGQGQLLGLNTWAPPSLSGQGVDEVYFAISSKHVIDVWNEAYPDQTLAAGLTSELSAQASGGSFSSWGNDLWTAYQSRLDELTAQVALSEEPADTEGKYEDFDRLCAQARREIARNKGTEAKKTIAKAKRELEKGEARHRIVELLEADRVSLMIAKSKVLDNDLGYRNDALKAYEKVLRKGEDFRDQRGVSCRACAMYQAIELRFVLKNYYSRYLYKGQAWKLNYKKHNEAGGDLEDALREEYPQERDQNGFRFVDRISSL
jgi:hypothetical protein